MTTAPLIADIAAAVERAARQRLVLEFLGRYPWPAKLLNAVWPGLVRAARRAGVEDDDIHALCLLGACEAATRFGPGRGAFDTWAAWWMRHAVGHHLRRWTAYGRRRECRPYHLHRDQPETVLDTAPARPEVDTDPEPALALTRRMVCWQGRRAVELWHGLPDGRRRTAGEIAADLGVKERRVYQLVEMGHAELRRVVAGVA